MIPAPRTLLAIDAGAATTTVSLLGRPVERWRLLGSLSAPTPAPPEALAEILAERVTAVDRGLADRLDLDPAAAADLPRIESATPPPRTLVVIGASRRAVGLLEAAATRTSWRVRAASPETHDPREMTELALRLDVDALLLGCGDPPGPDERGALDDVAALVGAVARRRPELRIVLAGPIGGLAAWREAVGDEGSASAESDDRIVAAPALRTRDLDDEPLRAILEGLLPRDAVTRHAAVRAAVTLADILNLRLEVLDVGYEGGLRAVAAPGVADQGPDGLGIRTTEAALVRPVIDDRAVEEVLAWTTGSLDRHRMGDRLLDLRSRPWADASGEGARLRLAAARAALVRLAAATPDLGFLPTPDLTLVAGGAFAAAPPRAVALAIADTVRRAGATQLAIDHARLLGPIGTIEDPDERRGLLRDLADDMLVPLGSLVVVAGAPAGRRGSQRVGQLALTGDDSSEPRELRGGEVAFVPLAPGARALATLEFRDTIRFGRRARRVAVPVAGGVGGLTIDLRDVPLRLPERRDRRRSTLAAWGELAWPGDER